MSWVVAGVFLLIAAAGGAWFFLRMKDGAGQNARPVAANSVAVLPFANLTGDPSMEYFGDGVAEELIDSRAHVPGLKVPSRTSSFAYKGHGADVRRIAHDLGVALVLEGSVRSAGDRVRVSAQLVDATTGYHLWSQTYDRQITDVFALEDELAAAIQLAMRGQVDVPMPARATPPTQDVQAYLFYLRARALTLPTSQGFHDAVALYDEALARDPGFARAYAGRAFTRVRIAVFGYPVPNVLDDAERDARKALALDSTLGAARSALGETRAMRTQWLEADTHFRAGLIADPADPLIHGNYAVEVLAPAGKLREAQQEARESFRLAPADTNSIVNRAVVSWYLGLDADATEALDLGQTLRGSAAPEFPPGPQIRGARDARRALCRRSGAHRPRPGASDSRAEAIAYRDFIVEFAMLGASDEAYDLAGWYLREFSKDGNGSGPAWGFLWLPEMRGFRADPRFQDFAARLHLIEYWQRWGPPEDCSLKDGQLACGNGA